MSALFLRLADRSRGQETALHRFTISCGDDRRWRLDGDDETRTLSFPNLTAALDHARRSCDAAPAEIEIWVDGFYIYVHQRTGWPERICGADRAA